MGRSSGSMKPVWVLCYVALILRTGHCYQDEEEDDRSYGGDRSEGQKVDRYEGQKGDRYEDESEENYEGDCGKQGRRCQSRSCILYPDNYEGGEEERISKCKTLLEKSGEYGAATSCSV